MLWGAMKPLARWNTPSVRVLSDRIARKEKGKKKERGRTSGKLKPWKFRPQTISIIISLVR